MKSSLIKENLWATEDFLSALRLGHPKEVFKLNEINLNFMHHLMSD